jgi:hypothetical protein
VATFLSREEWAKPRGRKSHQRRCGSDDRGEAGLRPDQAINEATCVRVLNHNLWRSVAISVSMNKRPERFRGERETISCKRQRRLPGTDRGNIALPRLGGPDRMPAASLRSSKEDCLSRAHVSIISRSPRRSTRLFDEGGKRSSLGQCDRKKCLGRVLHHPARLQRAGLRPNHQARP